MPTDLPFHRGDAPKCGVESCEFPQWSPLRPGHVPVGPDLLRRCALHEIASYNADELVEWGEENAADMVHIARAALGMEEPNA